jgi:hypothetical protein
MTIKTFLRSYFINLYVGQVEKKIAIFFYMNLFLGIWKPSKLEVQNERDVLIHSECHNPIERFPEKIDQLLEALNRVCFHFLMIKNQLDPFLLFRSTWISKSERQGKR